MLGFSGSLATFELTLRPQKGVDQSTFTNIGSTQEGELFVVAGTIQILLEITHVANCLNTGSVIPYVKQVDALLCFEEFHVFIIDVIRPRFGRKR